MMIRRVSARPTCSLEICERGGQWHLTVALRTAKMVLSSGELLVLPESDHDLRVLTQLTSVQAELKKLASTSCALPPRSPIHPGDRGVEFGGGSSLSEGDRALLRQFYSETDAYKVETGRLRAERLDKIQKMENQVGVFLSDVAGLPPITSLFSNPVPLLRQDRNDDRFFILHNEQLWASPLALSMNEWSEIINQQVAREMRRLKRALGQPQEAGGRTAVPVAVRRAVWVRDGGACARCGSRERLEFDHIIPFSQGGGMTERNLELLCETCNRAKSDELG
jgi:5-methylcytosine-specific restriction endonuclease McrA